MEATDEEKIPSGDSDGFLTVLSRHGRKKQRREAAQGGQDGKGQEDVLNPPPPPKATSDIMDRIDPGALCHHLTASLWNSLRELCKIWQPICFRPLRERPMSVVFWMRRREELLSIALCNKGNRRREGGLSRTSVGKVMVKSKKSSNSLLFPVTKKKSCF